MGLPFGMADHSEFAISGFPEGEGTLKNRPCAIWATLPASAPASTSTPAINRMLDEGSYTQDRSSFQHFQTPSVPYAYRNLTHGNPRSNAYWVRQLQGSFPQECYSIFGASALKDSVQPYPLPVSVNGGSLVLDSARGKLVNASNMTAKEIMEAKALAASKSHSEAERRRRERINTHLATLRTLLPSSTKTDKASLLAEVIDQVKTLKRQVSEIHEYGPTIPTDHDHMSIEKVVSAAEGKLRIKACICCDDRPDFINHLRETIDTLRLRTLKAEISTLAGRIKSTFLVTLKEEAVETDEDVFIKRFQDALRTVMDVPSPAGEPSPGGTLNKRPRTSSFETPGYT
ncbi:hypothetical protein KP509_01G052000 [Ceratopteris richardii]|uniref:BHLH domain-containing protein n=1 Tax=Ceratopteris richardii TaxID=49495 RepID=A0A8T2VPG3_CERRI|nr:hypothetical protein KP509_01G052000 [Ceratopteris richardii]